MNKQATFQINDRVQIIANEDALLNGLTGYVAGFDGEYVSVAISAFDYTTYLMPASAIEAIEPVVTCPACGAANLSDAHLMQEYKDMQKASFGIFKRNAAAAQDAVAALLLARGITHIPNIFGDIAIRPIIDENSTRYSRVQKENHS